MRLMAEIVEKELRKIGVTISKPVLAVICIIFGVIVIAWKESLNLIVGLFLILEGALILTDYLEIKKQQQS